MSVSKNSSAFNDSANIHNSQWLVNCFADRTSKRWTQRKMCMHRTEFEELPPIESLWVMMIHAICSFTRYGFHGNMLPSRGTRRLVGECIIYHISFSLAHIISISSICLLFLSFPFECTLAAQYMFRSEIVWRFIVRYQCAPSATSDKLYVLYRLTRLSALH